LTLACAAALAGLAGCGIREDTDKTGAAAEIAHPESLWTLARWEAAQGDRLLVDVRPDSAFALGHWAGARQVGRDDLSLPLSTSGGLEGMALDREGFRDLLDSLGATAQTQIVVCDGVGGCDAARFWWLCRLYGHDAVALLDGPGPSASSPPRAPSVPDPIRRGYQYPGPGDPSLLASLTDVAAGRSILLDGRTEAEFLGQTRKSGAAHAGRIPGSLHWDWGRAVDLAGDGRIRQADPLRTQLAQLGITDTTPVITYCHSGVRSAHTTFVFREILGYRNVANYDGSWVEWSHAHPADPALPADAAATAH